MQAARRTLGSRCWPALALTLDPLLLLEEPVLACPHPYLIQPSPTACVSCANPPLQVGMGGMECYEKDFEEPLLAETAAYYKRKAAEWIAADSCPEYMVKVGVERPLGGWG